MNWYSDTLTNISVMVREEKCPLHSGNGSARLLAQQKFPGTYQPAYAQGVLVSPLAETRETWTAHTHQAPNPHEPWAVATVLCSKQ
jgi:hypothetical protein